MNFENYVILRTEQLASSQAEPERISFVTSYPESNRFSIRKHHEVTVLLAKVFIQMQWNHTDLLGCALGWSAGWAVIGAGKAKSQSTGIGL